jgi:hypothetical protein
MVAATLFLVILHQQFQIQNQLGAFQPLRPHPPTPSPNSGRRGAGKERMVSCSLSQAWERAGVRAKQCRTPSEFLNLKLVIIDKIGSLILPIVLL